MKIVSDLSSWLDNTAQKISDDQKDPERWDTPVLYLLEALESESEQIEGNDIGYEKMLIKVKDALSDWLEDHTWGY
ncbi:MAG: hypothetical protein ACK2TU_04930 [Anaerolineales bacterium]|jgi:hypothetical protein